MTGRSLGALPGSKEGVTLSQRDCLSQCLPVCFLCVSSPGICLCHGFPEATSPRETERLQGQAEKKREQVGQCPPLPPNGATNGGFR